MTSSLSNPLGNNGGRFYSTLVKPVLVDCNFTVDSSNGLGITGLKGSGVWDVFMYTSTSAGTGNSGVVNPMAQSASQGYALVRLKNNYAKLAGAFKGSMSPPLTGGNLAINGTALTVGVPYVITAVGHATAGAVTIAPVADVAGSLASTWFRLYDAYGNTFIIWFSVSGVGAAPVGVSGTLVQQSIATSDSAATIGTALAVTIAALPSGVSGVYSFTAAGTTTVTVTSTATNPYGPLPGAPADGTVATGFTFAATKYNTNLTNWQTVGVPKGVAPAVGVSFIALATGQSTGGGSTGTVKLASVSGVSSMELVGDPNLSLGPVPAGGSPNNGGWILVKFLVPAVTMGAYTPAGTVAAPTFTGSALGTHAHDLLVKGGQAASTTNDVAVYTALLGKEAATDATILGSASGTSGGVIAISAGTPAGTNSAPAFTGTAASLTGAVAMVAVAPTDGSLVRFSFYLEQSSVVIAGE